MYNSYIAQQRFTRLQQTTLKTIEQDRWKTRYHQKIQPKLMAHYQKRINSFMHQMQVHPVHIQRNQDMREKKKEKHFTFRAEEDWRSLKGPLERGSFSYNLKGQNEKHMHSLTISDSCCFIQNQTHPSRVEFRSRNKSKQINAPMKYSYRIKNKSEDSAKYRKRLSQQQNSNYVEIQSKQISNKLSSRKYSDTYNIANSSSTNRHEENDQIQFIFTRDKSDNIEDQAKRYQKDKEEKIMEKKMHFKKLMDLATKSKDKEEQKTINKILRKCGLLRKKTQLIKTETSQIDNFSKLQGILQK